MTASNRRIILSQKDGRSRTPVGRSKSISMLFDFDMLSRMTPSFWDRTTRGSAEVTEDDEDYDAVELRMIWLDSESSSEWQQPRT